MNKRPVYVMKRGLLYSRYVYMRDSLMINNASIFPVHYYCYHKWSITQSYHTHHHYLYPPTPPPNVMFTHKRH